MIITVRAAVLTTTDLILYKVDGDTYTIPQGDHRVARILNEHGAALSRKEIREIDVSHDGSVTNTYAKFEEQTNGLVRFFRVAKNKLKSLFGTKEAEPVVDLTPREMGQVFETSVDKQSKAIADVMKHAKPASDPSFSDRDIVTDDRSQDTVVAVVGDKVIPDVQHMKAQLARANELGSPKAVQTFLERLSKVNRQHSIEDLMKFMRRNDMPIAEDGMIVAYKALNRKDDVYVDIHSRRVTQRVGSRVFMAEKLVDHNRQNECSNGLHIARRGYVAGFPGDVCTIVKIAPEDVIAVPAYDSNKMRVCGYNIIFELSPEDYQKLKNNTAFTNTEESRAILGRALAGDHPDVDQTVEITEHMGGGLIITDLKSKAKPKVVSIPASALSDEIIEDRAPTVEPTKVMEETGQKPAGEAAPLSRGQKAQALHEKLLAAASGSDEEYAAAVDLWQFKKAAKVGWGRLGLAESTDALVKKVLDTRTSK